MENNMFQEEYSDDIHDGDEYDEDYSMDKLDESGPLDMAP